MARKTRHQKARKVSDKRTNALLSGLQNKTARQRAEEQMQFVLSEMKIRSQVADTCYTTSLRPMKKREGESLLHRNAVIVSGIGCVCKENFIRSLNIMQPCVLEALLSDKKQVLECFH